MFDFLSELLADLLSGGTDFDVAPTDKQRVRHALRISRRRRPLTPEQRKFATTWLQYGLDHLAELRLESKEVALRVGLLKVQRARVVQKTS